MIKDYKLISAWVNVDVGAEDEKICCVALDIRDKESVKFAEDICKFEKGYLDDGMLHYVDGWIVECNVDEDVTSVGAYHELYYIGDDGRELICILEGEDGNEELIANIDAFLINELTYVA